MSTIEKNLVFQVQIKPNGGRSEGKKKFHYAEELYNYSTQRATAYAEKNGAEYFRLTTDEWLGSQYSPAYHKLYIYKLFEEGYDKIMYLDSDAVITKICPNLFENDEFSAMMDYGYNTEAAAAKQKRFNERLGIPDEHIYFCSGTVLFDRKYYEATKDHWRAQLNVPQPQHDQSLFNVLVGNHYGKYTSISNEWGHWGKKGKYIQHITTAGGTKLFDEQKFLEWESKL